MGGTEKIIIALHDVAWNTMFCKSTVSLSKTLKVFLLWEGELERKVRVKFYNKITEVAQCLTILGTFKTLQILTLMRY